jgi:hypothetical protein
MTLSTSTNSVQTFELLTKLGLPEFTRDNWQSNIRQRVRVHSLYHDIERWGGFETSDIVYNDRQGQFTNMLIEQGYLDSAIWTGCCPKYCIEVKSTTGLLQTQFFVSQNQYDMMEHKMLPDDAAAAEIYLIARVFNLGRSGMGLKLYVDPARLRRDGTLAFKTDKYTVTPVRL